jgi:microcompartment protein CcmK/EutM
VNLARVIGRVVATRRVDELGTARLVLLQPVDEHGVPAGAALVAADPTVRAGDGATVWCVHGSDAVDALEQREPVDAVVVGLVDRVSGAAR